MGENRNQACDVIITYCWNRVGYNILRSLSAKGLKVIVADTSKRNICSMSKFHAGSFIYPDPFTEEAAFIACLREKIQELKPKVLLPTHDESLVIMKHIHEFPKDVIIPYMDYHTLLKLSNKITSTQIAAKAAVPVPKIYNNINEINSYPVVFKTAVGNSAKGVFFPCNKEALEYLMDKYDGIETFIEDKICGTDYSVDCVRWDGFFHASVYKALVTKTDGGGTTTQRIIVEAPILIDYAKKILDYVNFKGVCGLDFRYDSANNVVAFIEINARFTGGIATPIAAGFDIPYVLYCLATANKYDALICTNIGTKTKWILGDFITIIGRILSLKLSKVEMKQAFCWRGFNAYDDYRKDDKKAILGEFYYYLNKLLKNRKLNP